MTGTAPSLLPCKTGCLSWHVAKGPQGCREQELELGSGSPSVQWHWVVPPLGLVQVHGEAAHKGRCGYRHHRIVGKAPTRLHVLHHSAP